MILLRIQCVDAIQLKKKKKTYFLTKYYKIFKALVFRELANIYRDFFKGHKVSLRYARSIIHFETGKFPIFRNEPSTTSLRFSPLGGVDRDKTSRIQNNGIRKHPKQHYSSFKLFRTIFNSSLTYLYIEHRIK